MPPIRYVPGLLLLLAGIVTIGWLTRHQWGAAPAEGPDSLEQRLALELPALDAWEAKYAPVGSPGTADLTLDAIARLKRVPGVGAVHSNGVKRPTARIVHFQDYHTEDEQDLAAEFPHATAAEVAKMHRDLLLRVELIQAEELAALRCLTKHHGLEDVWAEELTPDGVAEYLETLQLLKQAGNAPTIKPALLKMGAASRLFIDGHLTAVLPLDVAGNLDASKTLEPDKVKARDAGIAARLLKVIGTCQVIVPAGAHDLGPHLPAGVEYLRVEPLSYGEFAGE